MLLPVVYRDNTLLAFNLNLMDSSEELWQTICIHDFLLFYNLVCLNLYLTPFNVTIVVDPSVELKNCVQKNLVRQ